jgi:DNA polymerase-4
LRLWIYHAMSRLVMHVDLDAFFAAVEQRDNPPWRGLPLVVGAEPGRRGVVATCSYEARRYGVHSAMPTSEAARRLPPETVYVRPSMDRHVRVSRQIMAVLETISPLVEKASIWTPSGISSVGEPCNGVWVGETPASQSAEP